MSPKFAIVNTCDAPCRRHVCEWIDGVGYCYMAREFEPHLKKYDGMRPSRPTDIEEFGFDVSATGKEAVFRLVRESFATYEDGMTRRWQDSAWAEKFTLPLVRGVSRRSVRMKKVHDESAKKAGRKLIKEVM